MVSPVLVSRAGPPQEEPELTAEPWVSVEDVAKHIGVAKDSVYRWIEQKGTYSAR